MFPQPYPSGSTYLLGVVNPLGTALFQAVSIMPIISYHKALGLVATALSQQPFTQPHTPPHKGSSYHQIDGRYPTPTHATSQPHSSMLSLPYPYGMPMVYPYPMPIPMVVPQPCTATTHTPHTEPQRDHERHTASHGHVQAPPRHSTATEPQHSQSQRQAPPKPTGFFINFDRAR